MADLSQTQLDPNVPENTGGFTLIPEGQYKAVIVADRLSPTKAGNGKMLEIKVQIIDGQYQGQTLVDRLNIVNVSAQSQAIGQGQLKRICSLCGVSYPPANTDGLIGKPLSIAIKVEDFTSNTTGKVLQSNKISAYNPVNTAPPPVQEKKTTGGW